MVIVAGARRWTYASGCGEDWILLWPFEPLGAYEAIVGRGPLGRDHPCRRAGIVTRFTNTTILFPR